MTATPPTAWQASQHRRWPRDDRPDRRGGGAPPTTSVGQIYLLDNPLLRTPLSREDVKPRLLDTGGTTPGLNFLYAHLTG